MGVTLERVQNKFACIIGELCSEPDILSEFAIWLDLRLAEYKAKGAIQLECSGETPDPTWLRGHKKPPKRIKSPQMERLHHYDPASQYNEDMSQDVSERLSPDIVHVVVKEEIAEGNDVFPVSIHRHDISTSNRNHARKRSSADGSLIKHSGENSPYKMQRLSPSTSVLEPVNQSLMSIISENTADDSADMTANLTADFSNIDSSNIDNSSYIQSPNPVASTSGGDSTDQQDGSNSVFKTFWIQDGVTFSSAVEFEDLSGQDIPIHDITPSHELTPDEATPTDHVRQLYPTEYPDHLSNNVVQQRIRYRTSKNKHAVKEMARTVANLERWLWVVYKESRPIEKIPPPELDEYLCTYYEIVRAPDGSDYRIATLGNRRSKMERFLRENKYPASIINSVAFMKSISVYAQKRQYLTQNQKRSQR